MVLLALIVEERVRVVPVVAPEERKPIFLVTSVPSMKNTVPTLRDLLERVSVVVLPRRVSVVVGRVKVPEFRI